MPSTAGFGVQIGKVCRPTHSKDIDKNETITERNQVEIDELNEWPKLVARFEGVAEVSLETLR